ncbi:MAG: hypothetical protein AAFN77_16985 [Planctomycetota bacterium]
MTTDEQTGEFQVIEELTAYLDGELDEQTNQQVEQRLNSDPAYLAEMQSLQQTWDVLDRLPRTEPGSSFTKTTMEMVVQEAAREAAPTFSWFWIARIFTCFAAFGVLFFVGFSWYRSIQTQSESILIDHLSTIENHERYTAVNLDLGFLEQMNQRGFFSRNELDSLSTDEEYSSEFPIQSTLAVYSQDQDVRTAWIESLDVNQKSKLKKRLDDFQEFPPERRDALVEFGRSLENHENRDELVDTLNQYFSWLKTIEAGPRSRLLDTPTEERLNQIAEIRTQQARERFGATNGLIEEDAELLFGWFRGMIDAHEDQIREHFPSAVTASRQSRGQIPLPVRMIDRLAKRGQLNHLVDYLIEIDRPFIEAMVMRENDIEVLMAMLTPAARRALQEQNDEGQRDLIIQWVNKVNQSYFNVSREQLMTFYESLSDEERDELDQLPFKVHLVRLKELYLARNRTKENRTLDWRQFLEMENPFRRPNSDQRQ